MMDWVTPFLGLLGVVVGAGIQEFRIWREKKDKYMDMVFEKRLDAHQGAYYWCMKLFSLMSPSTLMGDGGVEAAFKGCVEGSDWLIKNALYLDEDSRVKMNQFFVYVTKTCGKYLDETSRKNINTKDEAVKLLQHARDVVSSIKRGVGVKYLPEPRILGESIGEMKSLDDEWGEGVAKFVREQKS